MTTTTFTLQRFPRRAALRRWLALSPLLIAVASCGGSDGATGPAAPNGAPRSVGVTKVALRAGDMGISASGLLVPHEVFTATSDVPGIAVARVMVNEGDIVARGQPLAALDNTLINTQIAQQQAALAQQRTLVTQAQAEAARAQPLSGEGILSEEAMQARQYKAATTLGGLRVQEAQLRDLQARASRMVVRAPVAGRVMERRVQLGDISGAPAPMFTIVPGGTMELEVQVPEARISALTPGTPALVTLTDGEQLDGRVARVSVRIDQQSAQGTLRLSLAPRPGQPWPLLRSGASGTARFQKAGGSLPTVPEGAVQYDTAGASVMALGRDNRVHKVRVRTGTRADGFVELIDGPAPGTTVVAASAAFVSEGEKVTPVPISETASSKQARARR